MTDTYSIDASASKQVNDVNSSEKTKDFILKAVAKHGNTYSYDKSVYLKSTIKVEIYCFGCKSYFKQLPYDHTQGRGCNKCMRGKGRAKKTTAEFISEAKKTHKNKYSYGKSLYKSAHEKIIITCPIHSDFEQQAASHLTGIGCPSCGGVAKGNTDSFIARAKEVHKTEYCYKKTVYRRNTTKVAISCLIHGVFFQTPKAHINGQGCPKCSYESCGWGRTQFNKACDRNGSGDGLLYVIKCTDKLETFFKIGVTSRSVGARFSSTDLMPYSYKVVHEVHGKSDFIFSLERSLLKVLCDHKYSPSIYFEGTTECFTTIKPVEKLLKQLTTSDQLQLIA